MALPIAPAPGLTDRELELRRRFIGASESAAILGVNPYCNAADVYHQKIDGVSVDDTLPMQIGRLYEPMLLQVAADSLGVRLTQSNQRRTAPDLHMQATIDSFVVGRNEIVECKKVHWRTYYNKPDLWGDDGTDHIPEYYLIQVQHQLAVLTASTGGPWDTCHVVVCIGDDDFRVYTIQRDEDLCDMIVAGVEDFWNGHIVPEIPPADAPNMETLSRLPRKAGGPVLEGIDADLVRRYRRGKKWEKRGSAIAEEARRGILAAMGTDYDRAFATDGTQIKLSMTTRRGLNNKQLTKDHPEIAEAGRSAPSPV